MGWFSRASSELKPPRWGFQTGWSDFVIALRTAAREYALTIDDAQLVTGRVPLPEDAAYEYWDLRAIAAVCRDSEPQQWRANIRGALLELYGRPGHVELVERAPAGARAADVEEPTDELRESLRVQLFGAAAFAILDRDAIACQRFGDAWLAVVADVGGGEVTVTRQQLADAGIAIDEAFTRGLAAGFRATVDDVQTTQLALAGAMCEVAVANGFYLSAVMLTSHARLPPGTPIIVAPLTWHHWVLVTLGEASTRATLASLVELVAALSASVAVPAAERIGNSLWWWPPGELPTPFTLDALPAGLAAALR